MTAPTVDGRPARAIILDTDPGIGTPGSDVDDGLAIALGLLHPNCDLLGLTLVAGNVEHAEGPLNLTPSRIAASLLIRLRQCSTVQSVTSTGIKG